MIKSEIRDQYTVTIGIECHVQLKTATKLFSSVSNDARDAEPNTLVSHIDFGMPGALPVLNAEAVRLSAKAAFALGSVPQPFSKFDRKHYFYPDLPKGYQITQFDQPIVLGGSIVIDVDGRQKTVGITRAHMEEDAGKSTHPAGKQYSLVDLNRAGTPLLEIVSEPDMHSAAEAKAYARELYLRMKYADVSDANLYYGNMRFDVNVSVSKTDELGTRSETKNLNSFRSVEKAVDYEVIRQIELLEKGEIVIQETRGWDDAKQRTVSQRTKEDAHDYRYFADPDLPPVTLDDAYIEAVRSSMPVLPDEWRNRLVGLGLDRSQTDVLLEAEVDDELVSYLPLIEQSMVNDTFAKQLAQWFVNTEIPLRKKEDTPAGASSTERHAFYASLYMLVEENKLSSTNAKALIAGVLTTGEYPMDVAIYAERQGYIQESDAGAIAAVVAQVIKDNPQAAQDVRDGEAKAVGFLVGQVMKLSQGKANPQMAQDFIKNELAKTS
jgi:aspartyl-tRNA(Asn)/glutamyl-tRNA(Gln) amidotransferase subunit B